MTGRQNVARPASPPLRRSGFSSKESLKNRQRLRNVDTETRGGGEVAQIVAGQRVSATVHRSLKNHVLLVCPDITLGAPHGDGRLVGRHSQLGHAERLERRHARLNEELADVGERLGADAENAT